MQVNLSDPAQCGQTPERLVPIARSRLAGWLAELRAAPTAPQRLDVTAKVAHNMANWLPEAEREAVRTAFRAECARLGAPPYSGTA